MDVQQSRSITSGFFIGESFMNKKELIEGPSCLTRAEDDEPLFVLRAHDELAASVVRQWADKYIQSKGGTTRMTPAQLAKLDDAMNVARAMEKWRVV
jgi:hypothetical protein